ncbi:hypothetical protein [Arthrobacter ulcerisalmonis]|uniref:hypothetical protein n=1 Tax=Arthrobacter ulcerisalmonis TaxID=2483813 RepID=UPI0013577600|nr:hypothetical protein [Arthrobacter ulcerisalmonis]
MFVAPALTTAAAGFKDGIAMLALEVLGGVEAVGVLGVADDVAGVAGVASGLRDVSVVWDVVGAPTGAPPVPHAVKANKPTVPSRANELSGRGRVFMMDLFVDRA